jgi:hypothetical protein
MSIRLGRSDSAAAACGVSKPSAIAHVQQEKEAMESPHIADFERTDVDPQKKIIIDRRAPEYPRSDPFALSASARDNLDCHRRAARPIGSR